MHRKIYQVTLSALLSAMTLGFCLSRITAAEAKRPNILFILADDLGWPDVSCNGNPPWQTPNIDQLAREGMRFTSAYAASSVCSPTRASILTGKYPHRLGMTGILEMVGKQYKVPDNAAVLSSATDGTLPVGEVSLASALREGGYATCMIGKWHVGGHPKDYGFDAWPMFARGNGQKRFVDGEFFTDKQAEAAIQWMGEKRDRPFFLYFATHAVHNPFAASQTYIEQNLARGLPAKGPWNATYAGFVRHLDDAVGRLLTALDARNLAQDTLVIFFSDNGGRGLDISRNDPFRGAKGNLYEGGIREPLIIRWPGRVKAGTTSDTPVISTDFYPTLLACAGLPLRPAQHRDGISFASLFDGTNRLERDTFYWHMPHYSTAAVPSSAIRVGDWKLIKYYSDYRREWDDQKQVVTERHASARVELYNLHSDPSEEHEMASQQPAIAADLQRRLEEHLKATGARLPPANPTYDPKKPEKGLFEM
jgi:arylsulfatase A-like enzyme